MTTLQETKTNKSDLDLRIYHDALKYYKTKLHKCFDGGGCKWFLWKYLALLPGTSPGQ